jgi:hypothetical protein
LLILLFQQDPDKYDSFAESNLAVGIWSAPISDKTMFLL